MPIQALVWYYGQRLTRDGICCNHTLGRGALALPGVHLRGRVNAPGPAYVSSGPPDFEEELADCTAELGETVKLACRVTGTPKPIVSWYKGRPLGASGY